MKNKRVTVQGPVKKPQMDYTPPPPCASTALSRHRVGVEPLFSGIFGTSVFVVPHVRWGLKPFYRTLQSNDVCFDAILSHSCCSPSTAHDHLHLRALLDVVGNGHLPSCAPHTGTVLSKHEVGGGPLFGLALWDRDCACTREGGGVCHTGGRMLRTRIPASCRILGASISSETLLCWYQPPPPPPGVIWQTEKHDGLWTEVCGQQKQSNDPSNNQHILTTPIIGRR